MHFIKSLAVPAIALLAMIQYCPAPVLPIISITINLGSTAAWIGAIGGVAGAVTGGISAAKDSRDLTVKRSHPQREFKGRIKRQDTANLGLGTAWEDCRKQLANAFVTFSAPSPGTVVVTGMPPACMTLSGVLTGKYNEGNPVPLGTDSISFSNLSNESIGEIQRALDSHPAKH